MLSVSNATARLLRGAACLAAFGAAALHGHPAHACSTAKPVAVHETWTPSTYGSKGAAFTVWTGPTDHGGQLQIAYGPNKALWVASSASNAIMEFAATGRATFFPTPTANSKPESLDTIGNLVWFTEWNTSCVGYLTTTGTMREFATSVLSLQSTGMAADKHGISWFVTDNNGIGRINPLGSVSFYTFADQTAQPTAITLGPDGNMCSSKSGARTSAKSRPRARSPNTPPASPTAAAASASPQAPPAASGLRMPTTKASTPAP